MISSVEKDGNVKGKVIGTGEKTKAGIGSCPSAEGKSKWKMPLEGGHFWDKVR